MLEKNKVYHGKMEDLILQLDDESIDVILTDPPYLYLKNQKLDVPFDEDIFFTNAKRVLKNNGFIVLFGRGSSFYRWNTRLDEIGFVFKEEFIWDKGYCTSPLMPISRVHETISTFTKGKGIINKFKIPYLEMKSHNINSIIQDIKRLKSIFTQEKSMKTVLDFLEKNLHSLSPIRSDYDSTETFMPKRLTGSNESAGTGDRCVNVLQSIKFGLNEKSIIKATRDHYTAIHPTQKPVRLLERLLQLILPKNVENPLILDTFAGSCSTLIAGVNLDCNVIGFEKDEEYYNTGSNRFYAHLEKKQSEVVQTKMSFF